MANADDDMNRTQVVKVGLGLAAAALAVLLFVALLYLYFHRPPTPKQASKEEEEEEEEDEDEEDENLMTFQGGEALTVGDILEAPGEVVGKSSYSTLYKAELLPRRIDESSLVSVKLLLRFLRPVCSAPFEEVADAIELLGSVRHPNLLPLLGFYAGRRGEKLLVYPFHTSGGNLSDYLRVQDADSEWLTWWVICRISMGIAKGLDHLHTGGGLVQKPIIHGNLKSKNILLDRNQPYISDFGLYMLMKPASGHQMLQTLATQGYRAPEVTEIRNHATVESDMYSLGIIFLELITGKDPAAAAAAAAAVIVNEEEPSYLPNYMRKAFLDRRIYGLVILTNGSQEKEIGGSVNNVTEEMIMDFLELAMACCSPSPSLRPNTSQVLMKLQQLINL